MKIYRRPGILLLIGAIVVLFSFCFVNGQHILEVAAAAPSKSMKTLPRLGRRSDVEFQNKYTFPRSFETWDPPAYVFNPRNEFDQMWPRRRFFWTKSNENNPGTATGTKFNPVETAAGAEEYFDFRNK